MRVATDVSFSSEFCDITTRRIISGLDKEKVRERRAKQISVDQPSVGKKVLVAQSCLTLCDPIDCSLPGSYVHGILWARILEWAVISFSRESSQPRDQTHLLHCRQILYCLSYQGSSQLVMGPHYF